MPTTPTRIDGFTQRRSGEYTVAPPHRSGAAFSEARRLGDREGEAAVEADAVGEAAVVAHAGGHVRRAQVLVAGDARLAGEAGPALPADADPRARLQVPDLGPEGRDRAHDLVAGDHRVAAHAPVAVHEVDVAVADAAVADPDLDVVRAQRGGLVHERLEGALLRVGGVGVEAHSPNLASRPPGRRPKRSNIARDARAPIARPAPTPRRSTRPTTSPPLRQEFVLPEGVVYLDGNSLGALPRRTVERLREVTEREWGRDLIRSWNANGWIDLPARVAGLLAPLIGASADEVAVADSTSVNVFKLLAGGLRLRPGPARRSSPRRRTSPPTSTSRRGSRACSATWSCASSRATACATRSASDVAVLLLTHVDFRTGRDPRHGRPDPGGPRRRARSRSGTSPTARERCPWTSTAPRPTSPWAAATST